MGKQPWQESQIDDVYDVMFNRPESMLHRQICTTVLEFAENDPPEKKKKTHYLVDPSNNEITSGNTYRILYVLEKERTFSSRVATTIQIVALIMNHLAIRGWVNVPMKYHPTIEDIILNRYLKVNFNIPPKELLSTPAILQSYHVPHLRMLNSSSAFSRKACSFNTAPTN